MDQDLTVTSTSDDTPPLTQIEIDQRVFDLYDEYCHGRMDRRVFLAKSAAVTAGGLAMAQALLPRYARAQTMSFTDPRIKARYVSYPSPGGTSGIMRGYLVQPAGNGPFHAPCIALCLFPPLRFPPLQFNLHHHLRPSQMSFFLQTGTPAGCVSVIVRLAS